MKRTFWNGTARRFDLSRWAPPGVDGWKEMRPILGGLGAAAVFALVGLLNSITGARDALYDRGRLKPDARMPDFYMLLSKDGGYFTGFLVVALAMLALAAWHYLYHHQGSKSIYLMRRLPDKWERHRRCWTLPVVGLVLSGVCALMMVLIGFGMYLLITPEGCLQPEQWGKLWRWIV